MPMVVLLIPDAAGPPSLEPASLQRLAELGVTSASLVRGEGTVGVVLEGWAFDPERSSEAASNAVAARADGVQTLHPVAQLAVSAARSEGGIP